MTDSRLRRLRDRTSSAVTIINEGCKITGLLTGSGDFLINGEIDGDCDLTGTVTLATNGFWKGTIKAGNVIVAGRRSDSDSLFDVRVVTFEDDRGAYDQRDAAGFIRLNALRMRIASRREGET